MERDKDQKDKKNDKANVDPPCLKLCQSPKCRAYHPQPKVPRHTPIFWIIGGPSSGKATQCLLLSEKYGFKHLLIGDILKEEVATGSSKSRLIEEIISKGGLVPTDIVLDVIKNIMLKNNSKGYILEGYPRDESQVVAFERDIAPVSGILYLEASPKTLLNRQMSRVKKLSLDGENEKEMFNERLNTFNERKQYSFLKDNPKLYKIDAEAPVEVVFQELVKILDPILENLKLAAERTRSLYS